MRDLVFTERRPGAEAGGTVVNTVHTFFSRPSDERPPVLISRKHIKVMKKE